MRRRQVIAVEVGALAGGSVDFFPATAQQDMAYRVYRPSI
jgi:hypothetical protein